jgi:hypothetical protein
MHWHRYFPFFLTAACVVLLTGALRGPSRPDDGPVEQPVPAGLAEAVPDPVATELLARAVARLQPPHLEYLQVGVWLQARLPGARYRGQGRYLLAPGQRFRLELQTKRQGGKRRATTTVLTVSDGRDLWLASRTGTARWSEVQRLCVGAILEGPDSPARIPALRSYFLQGQALRGLVPLMQSLQGELRWLRREGSPGEEVLTGTWEPGLAAVLAPPGQPWPPALPKVCRLVLRGPELWPARIEWYGPADDRGQMPLLIEMEFRDPVFNHHLPETEAAGLFAFEPGTSAVEDLTPKVLANLKATAEAIRTQPASGKK